MNIVPDIIKPIALLSGSHDDTAQTGQGCFMNVIAYLNGEPQITDQSPCVCVTLRPIVIFLNDFMNASERQQLMQFVCRAMGSATDDKAEILRRLVHVVAFSDACTEFATKPATKYAKYAAEYAAEYAVEYAKYAKYAEYAAKYAEYAKYAAESAAKSAEYAVEYGKSAEYAAIRQSIIAAGLAFLDAALPPLPDAEPVHVDRARELVSKFEAMA